MLDVQQIFYSVYSTINIQKHSETFSERTTLCLFKTNKNIIVEYNKKRRKKLLELIMLLAVILKQEDATLDLLIILINSLNISIY